MNSDYLKIEQCIVRFKIYIELNCMKSETQNQEGINRTHVLRAGN